MSPSRAVPALHALIRLVPGLVLAGALTAVAWATSRVEAVAAQGLNVLTLAIVVGIVVGNTVYPRLASRADPGVRFARQWLLRAGVILYGLRLTLQDVGHVGVAGVAVDAIVVASTFALAVLVGVRWLRIEPRLAMLVGAGGGICGAAAVMATGPVVRARPDQIAVAVATVVVFGTIAMFAYPALYGLGLPGLPQDERAFGLYIGSTVHEVAQVVVAGRAVGPDAAAVAIIAKMVRVMMLAPFLMLLAAWLARRAKGGPGSHRLEVPWFAVGFVVVVIANSTPWLPRALVASLAGLDVLLLGTAMAALGLGTQAAALRQAGPRPLLLALLLFGWLVVGGAAINAGVAAVVR